MPQTQQQNKSNPTIQGIDTAKLNTKKPISVRKLKQQELAKRVVASIHTGESLSDIGRDLYPNAKNLRQTVYQAIRTEAVQAEIGLLAKDMGLTADDFRALLSKLTIHLWTKDPNDYKPVDAAMLRQIGEATHVLGAQQDTQKTQVTHISYSLHVPGLPPYDPMKEVKPTQDPLSDVANGDRPQGQA